MPRVAIPLLLFLKLALMGECAGITFIDSTRIPVCENKREYSNHVFKNGYARQNHALQKKHYRDHKRYAQERGTDCSYPPQKYLKLYCQPFGRNGGLCFLRYKTLYQYGVCDGWGSRSEAAHTFLNLPAWNNESSAYNKVERIVVDYKMRNKRGDLKPNWGYCKHHKVILLCAPPLYINRKVSCFLCSLLIRSHSNRSVDCLATTNHYLVPANDSLTPANHSLVPANNKVLKLAT